MHEVKRTRDDFTRKVIAMASGDEPQWLSDDEKRAWTGLISLILLLPGELESPLRQVDLTLFEYLTLSHIADSPQRRIRMSELAFLANGSLSRLSNVVKRFEQRGWATRSPDPEDGRYTLAALTDTGFRLVGEAAPIHVRAVRELVLDPLTPTDLAALTRIAAKLKVVPPGFTAQHG
jgi:DNA-binding MarR family transcriptional regulator